MKVEKLEKYKNSSNIAYINNDSQITYAKLWKSAESLALYLSSEGNSPVIIYGHKEVEFLIAMIACLKANRPYVPVDISTPQKRLEKIIELTKSSILINLSGIYIDGITTIDNIYSVFEKGKSVSTSNNIAYIIFTSGSTGIPKGVPISYFNLNNYINWIAGQYSLKDRAHTTVLNTAVFSFDLSVADIYYSLSHGFTLVGLDQVSIENIDSIYKSMQKTMPNVVVLTPSFARIMLLDERINKSNIPSVDTLLFCGEVLTVKIALEIFKRFDDITIINAYGPTEATCMVTAIKISKEMLNEETLPIGELRSSATKIEIIDDEIVLSGPSVFYGYLDSNEQIKAYKTGDIGYIKDDLLYIKGRKDNQLKLSGYRIEIEEIEKSILRINEVAECVVVARKSKDGWVVSLKAFIVLNSLISTDEIKKRLNEHLPMYMVPKTVEIIKKIPLNSNVKYDRKKLV